MGNVRTVASPCTESAERMGATKLASSADCSYSCGSHCAITVQELVSPTPHFQATSSTAKIDLNLRRLTPPPVVALQSKLSAWKCLKWRKECTPFIFFINYLSDNNWPVWICPRETVGSGPLALSATVPAGTARWWHQETSSASYPSTAAAVVQLFQLLNTDNLFTQNAATDTIILLFIIFAS